MVTWTQAAYRWTRGPSLGLALFYIHQMNTVNSCNGYIQGGSKKVNPFIILKYTANQFSKFLAHIRYRKFATRGCIVSPPNTVCVTAYLVKLDQNCTEVNMNKVVINILQDSVVTQTVLGGLLCILLLKLFYSVHTPKILKIGWQ